MNGVLRFIEDNLEAIRADVRATTLAKKQARLADKAAGIKKRRADRTFSHAVRVHTPGPAKFRPAAKRTSE